MSNLFFSRGTLLLLVVAATRGGTLTSLTLGTGSCPQVAGTLQSRFKPSSALAPYGTPSSQAAADYIKIIYLVPLLASSSSPPTGISKFITSNGQPISNIAFTRDGNSLIVSTEDGRVMRDLDAGPVVAEPWGAYSLRQCHPYVVLEGIDV